MKIWNRMSTSYQKVGGGVPVWVEPPKRKTIGGLVLNNLQDMEKVSMATPVEYDYKNKTAKLLKCWKVTAVDVVDTNTTISVKATERSPELYAGMVIMVMPATLAGTGKAFVVGTVTEDAAAHTATFTVPTADVDTVAEGDFLVESAATEKSAAAAIYCVPEDLSLEDTIGGEQNYVGIARGVKYLYENTIPEMPDLVKANLKFVEWDWFQEVGEV